MNYSGFQKWLSSFLIFSLLFLQTFEVPMLSSTRAEAKVSADIISFIVEDSIYNGAAKSKILQYAKDIQAYLSNTRVVIFPIQKTTNPFVIASINEKLFYEGDEASLSRLVGTILIGEVPLPVVHKEGKAFMSMYPYIDFDTKSFVYDQIQKRYDYTSKMVTEEKPEIWHSVIRPNTGDEGKNKDELVNFFNKTHDFYNKQGLFSSENTLMEPRVFYMDTFHDQKTSSPDIWKSYNLYLENIEDITYRRFNKYLAQKLYDSSQGFYGLDAKTVKDPTIKSILETNLTSPMDLSKIPDITTKDIIEKSTKQFFEVLNGKYMGDVLRYIHNAGRYGDANAIRSDSVPVMIAKKDLFMRTTLKDGNTSIEGAIDNLLRTSLADRLKVAVSYESGSTTQSSATDTDPAVTKTDMRVYKNYFFGKEAGLIEDMRECTIVRGSTLKVESNRGYNIKNSEGDTTFLQGDLSGGACFRSGQVSTMGYWGGNSPLNLDQNAMKTGQIVLQSHLYKNFVKSIYDIAGSRELDIFSPLRIASPEDCLKNNMLLQPYKEVTDSGNDNNFGIITGWPKDPKPEGTRFSCVTTHQELATPMLDYNTYFKNLPPVPPCTTVNLVLDGNITKTTQGSCVVSADTETISYTNTYRFKTLSGNIMEHKSPTDEEYGIQLQEMITPSLPSDRDRYVDYLDKNLQYKKIVYPNLFRIVLDSTELDYPGAQKQIKNLLDQKTSEIRGLGGDIDLYALLASDVKALNAVTEGVIWNNMKNATLKYSDTLKRSLNRDGEQNISANDKKNDYEIAYIGAPGDARNMYIKVDPESKLPPPKEISDITDRVNNYHGLIDGVNISDIGDKNTEFKCGPPEGVPIWEWIPAIFCWLGTILPPTIEGGSCGGQTIGDSTNVQDNKSTPSIFADPKYQKDGNPKDPNNLPNGILDGYELIGKGDLKLLNPSKIFGYGETIPLEAELTKDGKIIDIDSFNIVSFDIKKLTLSQDAKVVYDRDQKVGTIQAIDRYINFKPIDIRAKNGQAKYTLSSKYDDLDAIFEVRILTKDRYGKTVVDKKSQPVTISIRSERISVQGKVKNGANSFMSSSVTVAGNANGILFNLKKIDKASIVLSENVPYMLNVYDDIDGTKIRDRIEVKKNEYLFRDPSILDKSGTYRFEFIDSKGIKGLTTITILPSPPVKIEVIPSSNTFVSGQKTTVIVRILDAFGNIAQGEAYKLGGSISGGAGFIDTDGKSSTPTISKNVIEGYTRFDITSTQVSDDIQLSFRIDKANIASVPLTLRAIDFAKISVEVEGKDAVIAGGKPHAVNFKILGKNNTVISDYNGILSLDFPKLSGSLSASFVRVINGISATGTTFTPGYVAEKNIRIQVQTPGIGLAEGNVITVLPDVPMSFSFAKKEDRMEAKAGNMNNTRATLYDRYGNIAYNKTGYSLTIDIPSESKKYATVSKAEYAFTEGILDFDIQATDLPGRGYLIGTVTPGLESNAFTVTDNSKATLAITGISKNVTILDTYYIFNKSKLAAMRYSSQYSVLLGGEYGDITQDGYLGGEILFNHDSKSLAVTTLLNNPWKEQTLFGFTPAGKYSLIQSANDTDGLKTTISDNGDKSYIAFYDSYRKEYIARAWLNIDPSRTTYLPCIGPGTDISACSIASQTTVFMKGFDGNISASENGGLTLFSENKLPLLRISSNGKMEKYPGVDLELDEKSLSNALGMRIVSNGADIGYVGIKFSSDSIERASSAELSLALGMNKNKIVFETLSSRYVSRITHLGVSSRGSEGIVFAFRDNIAHEIGELDPAYMAKSGPTGLEDYPKKTGIGWEDTNRMLLEVAAGTTIGNATKFYQTFSTITLGDAVSHLPKVSTTSNFDRTIGAQITVGNGERIESYKKIDVNGDSVPDLVIFYESGKIQLFINYSGSFKDMGYLAYVSDGGRGRKGVGDFFGDSYDDIVLTDTKGQLILLDNIKGKLTRITPIIVDESGKTDGIRGYIQQMELFDMDADGKTDIVILDDTGEISILYGNTRIKTGGDREHIFVKKSIEKGLGMRLSKDIRNDGGAFSYTGLVFPDQGTDITGEKLDVENFTGAVNQGMIDNIIYYQYAYQSSSDTSTSEQKRNRAIGSSVGSNMKRNADGTYAKDAQGNPIEDAGSIAFNALSGSSLTGSIDYDTAATNTTLQTDISGMIEKTRLLAGSGNTDFTALDNSYRNNKQTFIRSPFAEGKGLKVEKTYRLMSNLSDDIIQANKKIRVEIVLTNTSTRSFKNAVYLDSNEHNLLKGDQYGEYTLIKNGAEARYSLKYLEEGDFDYGFDFTEIAPGDVIKIQYLVTATPVAFGKMNVGLLEKKEPGDDIYGDIALSPNNICGGDLMIWRSVPPYARSYEKGAKIFVNNEVLPEELQKNAIDLNKNGVPDYIDDLIEGGKSGDINLLKKYSEEQLNKYNIDKNGNRIPDRGDSKGAKVVSYDPGSGKIQIGGLSSGNIDAINSGIDDVVKGLGCGFGGGGCINSPLNWAPLAPGSAVTAFGFPLTPLIPYTGVPVFAAPTFCGPKSPPVWPPCPIGAGGIFGPTFPASYRLFVTPTITGAVGVAACFGQNTIAGLMPPPGISPIIPGGNCIVAAMPLFGCKDDGSDGDAGSLGLGMNTNDASVNANACVKGSGNNILLPEDRRNIVKYVAGDTSRLPEINASMARGGLSSLTSGPLIGVGMNGGGESNFEVSIDTAALKNFDFGNILKIKNTRVSSFPDFLMDWATRQLEEVVNKLTSLPTLYIILPDFSGFDISGYKNFPEVFSRGKSADSTDYAQSAKTNTSSSNTTIGGAQSQYNNLVSDNANTINSLGKNISGVKAAYEFMSHLPLIKLQSEIIDISVPWLSFEEMDKWLINAKLTQKQWQAEFADKQDKWSRLQNISELDKKAIVRTEGLLGSLQENINIIEGYKKFPEKLQKYLTWKERYATQLLCNIEAIEFMMGGWISDNGKRFRTWVELYILIKAILKSWQLIVDLFYGYEAECAACRNERFDLKHFIFKLISAIIPKIPIIQFPKWPDVWLDLHNIRGGLNILLPEFHFNFVPMVLPQLPRLSLPEVPTLGIGLPSLPILPRLPELPELPDLPSLPTIKLPDLPPPPTIPKLFGGIAAVLEIFKLVAKILCIMRINPFVPEWRAGDQIAQITERQGKLPIDFLNIEFPNFSLSFIDAIKVTSFVNLEFDLEFIVAMSKATLSPLNQFSNDLSNIGSIVIPDINLQNTVPENIEVSVGAPQSYLKGKNKIQNKEQLMTSLLRKFSFDVLRNFVVLNRYIDTHSKELVTVEALRNILTENISLIRGMHDPQALAIADVLQRAVTYSGDKEAKFIQHLTNQNDEKFSLIKDYIKGERNETLRLKTEIDMILKTGSMNQDAPSILQIGGDAIKAQYLSTDTPISDDLKKKILATNTRILPSLDRVRNGGKDKEVQELKEMGDSFIADVTSSLTSFARETKRNDDMHALDYSNSMNSLLALKTEKVGEVINSLKTLGDDISSDSSPVVGTTGQSVSKKSSTASSYQYEGIYILDKNNKQVRLFDYIDGVDGKEELVYMDVDKDGDNDIIYRMDNSIYVKQNFLKDPQLSHISDSPKVKKWQDFLDVDAEDSRILAAPNYFEETFTTSNEINFSFRPANISQDSLFRLEYYDYIDRFDRIKSGETPALITPKTPVHKVDLIPELLNETVTTTTHTGFIGRNNILSFGLGSGEATITMNTYQTISSTSNGTIPIIISAGRTIYTDGEGAVISYLRDGEKDVQTLSFEKNTNYEFLKNTKIWIKSGKLYLFNASQEEKVLSLNDLKGLPILPGTKLELTKINSFASFSYFDGSTMRLDGPGTYQYYFIGKKAKEYSVSISASNDWYYAKLFSIEKEKISTSASLHLLSPQKEADTEGPLIIYGDTIRIPVYQKQVLNVKQYLEDISGIDTIWIDADLTKDTDGDGDVLNDRDSLNGSTLYNIKKGNTIYDIEIGAFDILFTKKIRLFAQDNNGNISFKDISLQVYPPVPEIQSLSGSIIGGNLSEILSGEPIDIFRLRNGGLSRLKTPNGSDIKTLADGTFSFPSKNTKGIVLTQSGKNIATIDERTGKITQEDTSFQIRVAPATTEGPLEIQVISPVGKVIFSEKINISPVSNIEIVSDYDGRMGTGIFILPNLGFSFSKNTLSHPSLPGGGYIINSTYKAIAGVSKGGDIYIIDPTYGISYATKNSYIVLRIQDASANIVASLLYKIDAEFVIR